MPMVTIYYMTGERVCEATYGVGMVERIASELGDRLLGIVRHWKPGQHIDARF